MKKIGIGTVLGAVGLLVLPVAVVMGLARKASADEPAAPAQPSQPAAPAQPAQPQGGSSEPGLDILRVILTGAENAGQKFLDFGLGQAGGAGGGTP